MTEDRAMPSARIAPAAFGTLLLLAACDGGDGDAAPTRKGQPTESGAPKPPPVVVEEAPVPPPVEEPGGQCEYAERRSSCTLDTITFGEPTFDGSLATVASYTSADPGGPPLLEKHYRVHPDHKVAFEAHMRAHSVVPCRWSVLTKGTCGDYPPEIVVPTFAP